MEWISANKQPPPIGEYVLANLEGETILVGQLMNNGWCIFFADGQKAAGTRIVTHWMPLPQSPNSVLIKDNPDRKLFAASAMQGLLAQHNPGPYNIAAIEMTCITAVQLADGLLTELSKPQQ